MKKFIFLTLALSLILFACTPPTQLETTNNPAKTDSADPSTITTPETTSQDPQTFENLAAEIETCPTKNTDLANCYFELARKAQDHQICIQAGEPNIQASCLEIYSNNMGYLKGLEPKQEVCSSLSMNPTKQKNCYHRLALVTKNSLLCNKSFDVYACQQAIYYATPTASWNLENEWPDSYSYTGEAEIWGWIAVVSSYGGEKVKVLELASSSIKNIPPRIEGEQFKLEAASNSGLQNDQIYDQLKEANENNPKSLVIEKIQVGEEGIPTMYVKKVN